MKKWIWYVLVIMGILLITGGTIAYRMYTKPHRDVTHEQAVLLTAQQLADVFRTDEAAANAKYLDKALEIKGEVQDINRNQDGFFVVNLKTSDPLFVINCTFKKNPETIIPGQQLVFKGICTGYIPDTNVVINEGVQVNENP